MTKREHLIAQREHMKDGIEGHRKRLAEMWENGQRSGWLFDKLNEQKDLMEEKYYKILDEICPLPKKCIAIKNILFK